MNQLKIHFYFEGKPYDANVTVIGGLDDTQYAISPADTNLAERFKTNIVRKVKDEDRYQYSLPNDPGGVEFMKALVKGLEESLKS